MALCSVPPPAPTISLGIDRDTERCGPFLLYFSPLKRHSGEQTYREQGYVYAIDCVDRFTTQLIKLYTLNMYSFLYVSHTSVKWFFKTLKKSI